MDSDFTLSTVNFRQGRSEHDGGEGTVAYLTFVDPQTHGGDKTDGKNPLDEGGITKGMSEPGNPEHWV